ncbi:DNA helicase-2 / ATP-dependent DNA helicase PcrA [Pseudarcicella hirudinis]|uniref:DNA 3'-5' helicase n=1 Tax=Pseudarcicella hirudinis TaxID=1079859 RepID=A0A1I5QVA7_9BACT|nr:UvrD-helicase domain-containing protein [Pseudarcicella hirudinis]SFP50228.1 DNA helicase-2 / ATP-dependent DNA helicase PcrA [Pseudarcicella hirudinis]
MNYIEGLNDPQREAVLHTNGPLMIIAGAGSGKTRVLTYRTAHLIEKGVDPFRILLLTFTNKAAGEMRERIEKVVGNEARNLWMGTFHSVFAKILRFECKALGYTSDFSIYDTDDSKSLLRSIIKERNLDDKVYKVNGVFNRISGAKNRLIGPDEYLNNPIIQADDAAAKLPEVGRLYKMYAERCFKANAMDFDDLLYQTNVLFRDHVEILHKYQHKFHYVMVDEFQDTNISQYLITKKLSAVHQNICVVGDDAQSIYAFRGADIQNILNFEKDYSDLTTIKLEENYRSTNNIVQAANSIIARNKGQLKKNVFTNNEEGALIDLIKAASDNEEGRLIATHIFESKMANGLKNNDFAILYRTNAQSRAFEEALRKLNIKYRIIGGLSFYQRREIKDLLAYLRFVINQNDEEAFKRIINLPKRGIGDTTVAKITVTAAENGVSVWDVVANINQFGAGRLSAGIEAFADLIKSFKIMVEIQEKDAYEVASHVAKASGILRELYEDKTVEGLSRYENVQELLNAIKEFVDSPENEDKSISNFLQTVSLLTTADNEEDEGENDRVTLMTIHGAKGLEFDHVYIVGMEEDLFPSQMMLQSRQDLEEERRLFYVAITRAEKRLMMSFAESRYQFGRLKACEPSRFLDEIDPKYLQIARNIRRAIEPQERPSPAAFIRKVANDVATKATPAASLQSKPKPVNAAPSNYTPSPDFTASDTSFLEEGQKVEHLKFGFGIVKKMDVNGNDRKATVLFEGGVGEKTLLLSFAKLRIL